MKITKVLGIFNTLLIIFLLIISVFYLIEINKSTNDMLIFSLFLFALAFAFIAFTLTMPMIYFLMKFKFAPIKYYILSHVTLVILSIIAIIFAVTLA